MKSPFFSLLCLLMLASVAPAAQARAFPLDDSLTQVLGSSVPMQWQHFFPKKGQPDNLIGQIQVRLHLNVARWQGQQVKIYQLLPNYTTGPFYVEWRGQGRVIDGAMRDGERVLIYQGLIQQPSLEDTLLLQITADGTRLSRNQPLQFKFEIEPE